MTPEEVLGFVLERFPGRVSLACSFQKEEAVLLDMLFELEPKARVFALDTHVLFPETYAVWRQAEQRYGTKMEVYAGQSLGRQPPPQGCVRSDCTRARRSPFAQGEPLSRPDGALGARDTGR